MILVPGAKIVVLPHIAKPVERKICLSGYSNRSTGLFSDPLSGQTAF
jgi:hypothetical protein